MSPGTLWLLCMPLHTITLRLFYIPAEYLKNVPHGRVTWADLSTEAPPGDHRWQKCPCHILTTYQSDTQCAEGASDPLEDNTRSSCEFWLDVTLKQKTGEKDKDTRAQAGEELQGLSSPAKTSFLKTSEPVGKLNCVYFVRREKLSGVWLVWGRETRWYSRWQTFLLCVAFLSHYTDRGAVSETVWTATEWRSLCFQDCWLFYRIDYIQ